MVLKARAMAVNLRHLKRVLVGQNNQAVKQVKREEILPVIYFAPYIT